MTFFIVSSSFTVSILYVLSESTKTGVPPKKLTVSAVAKNVNEGTKTASPSLSLYAKRGIISASVPVSYTHLDVYKRQVHQFINI